MEDLKTIITHLVDLLHEDIREFYEIYETYLIDLILSKNIDISLAIDFTDEKEAKKNILSIIMVINSALITIGVSKKNLTSNHELFQNIFEKNINSFSNYKSFLQLGLKDYINKHLFIILLDYLVDKNNKTIENLDLFDLLPYEFRNKLTRFRNEIDISKDIKAHLKFLKNDLENYFNPSNLTFKIVDFKIEDPQESLSEENILKKLQEARRENLEAISQPINQITSDFLLNKEKSPSFLDFFLKFPKLNQSITDKLIINIKQLKIFIRTTPEFLDLENLYHLISIFKMLGEELHLEPGYIKNVINDYISGKVFSTGKYHKPNPITTYHGLSVLSALDLLNNSEFVDLLDIEMFLENELNPFFPNKLILNFFTILSLKMLKKSGGIITDKSHLLEPLANLDLFNIENFNPSSDMFFYLSLLKLLDDRFNFNNLQDSYLAELEKQILPNGSVNGNNTDTARTLLTLVLLNSTGKEIGVVSELLGFLNQNIHFFPENQDFNNFCWHQNKTAFKVELRMLFWMLLALSQYF